jgi:cation diffusion facilitator family transporter
MHEQSIARWEHGHSFLGERHEFRERRTWLVVGLTTAMMIAEIVGGTIYGSMALVADGWHMSTHAAALAVVAFAYRFARRHRDDPRFSFGTGKFGELAGFASAIVLAVISVLIGYEASMRLLDPRPISFDEAVVVAVIGLGVNLLSAWLLRDSHDHHAGDHHRHHHHSAHNHHHSHDDDHNLRAAYLHVLADALTSVLAIVGLLAGRFYGLSWMDPLVGLVGAVVIAHWSVGLIRSSGAVLVDVVPNRGIADTIRQRLELGGDRVSDLHLWQLGPGHAAVAASVISDHPLSPDDYKQRLRDIAGLSHITIEVQPCTGH